VSFSDIEEILRFLGTEFSEKQQMSLARNPNISWQDICSRPDLNWDPFYLSSLSGISFREVLEKPISFNWDFVLISLNPWLDWSLIEEHPELPWNFQQISMSNRLITQQLIQRYFARIDFDWLSLNSALTYEIYLSYKAAFQQSNSYPINLIRRSTDARLVRHLISELAPENFPELKKLESRFRSEDWKLLAGIRITRGLYSSGTERSQELLEYLFLDPRRILEKPENFRFDWLSRFNFWTQPEYRPLFLLSVSTSSEFCLQT
jgi:hypothetical protein